MKSQSVDMMLKVAAGVLADISLAYPHDGGYQRDLDTLSRLIKTRGIGAFLFDLPNLDDMLLAGLRDGRLRVQGPLSRAVSKRTKVPRFASGLWLRVFDKHGVLLQRVDENSILFLRQLAVLWKKLEVPCSPKRLESAVSEYATIDKSLRAPSLDWESDNFDVTDRIHSVHFCDALDSHLQDDQHTFGFGGSSVDEGDQELLSNLQRTADEFVAALGRFNAFSASCTAKDRRGAGRGVKHGPGAVARKSGTVDKFEFPYFPRKLSRVFPGILMYPEAHSSRVGVNHEVPARLIAVPKTAKAPRLIAAEPEEHMWFQQLLLNWFNDRFKELLPSFIDLSDQEGSQDLARLGSLTGDLATVDLSSASDRLSCWTVERIFRNNQSLLGALQACRTRWIRNQIPGTKPYYLKLRKYASQGTACTFPVQTLVFLIIVLSVCRGSSMEDKLRYNEGAVRVFGDDIVIPTYGYVRLCRLLTLLQLKVNESKSFASGLFRESCGGDFYNGLDVTPVKVKHLDATGPDLRASMLDSSNNLHMKGFWRTADVLGSQLPVYIRKNVPVVSPKSGTMGLRSFVGSWYAHLPLRWNSMLHTVEYRSYGLRSKPTLTDRHGLSRLRKFLLENPVRGILDDSKYTSDILGRAAASDGVRWRALEPITGFRANRTLN